MTRGTVPHVRNGRSGLWRAARLCAAAAITGWPFDGRGRRRPIVHCCHHKVGTVWFQRVLLNVARAYGLSFYAGPHGGVLPRADIVVDRNSRLNLAPLPPFRGSHMIRDPRDVIVSGYFYHLRTDEPFVNKPRDDLEGRTYRETLQGLEREAGLCLEMSRAQRSTFRAMRSWDYHNPSFLELRYEDFIADESASFARLFRHYGFREDAIARAQRIASRFSRTRVRRGAHIRSGEPGEWREHFTPALRDAFKEQYGDLLIRLGYERDNDW